ncbi:MAG: flagellar basal body P-ring protein FlgI [Pirellulaceae bacterium]|nr:flagellar basal body P-ring protein FlgI [Pirellulaceae bacterium]
MSEVRQVADHERSQQAISGHLDDLLLSQPLAADGTPEDRSEQWLCHRRSFLLAGLLGLGGCQSWNLLANRSKTSLAVEADKLTYVSTMTHVWGAAPARIDGVGMVSELAATGSAPAPSRWRDELLEDLRIRKVPEPNKLLSENWTSLVLLQGILPAGCRSGTPFDVFVGLEPGSGTTSLEGGFLLPARLTPVRVGGGKVLQGSLAGTATGPVVVHSIFDGESRGSKVAGIVPGGGRSSLKRQLGLQTKSEYRTVKDSMIVAAAINARFNYIENSQRQPVANSKSDISIELEVPEIYRSNVNRYFHVIRNVAIGESAAAQVSRLERLEQQLRDPATAETASLRLEALGEIGIAILERALRHPDPKVRFMAAMSLVYQEKAVGCEELGRLAEAQWAFRWHALTALAAIPNPAGKDALRKLLQSKSIETRYGAVRCLVTNDKDDAEVMFESFGPGGEDKKNFAVKTVFSTSEPVIHLARFKEPEVVIFNPDQTLKAGFSFVVMGWTINSRTDGIVEIKHFPLDGQDRRVECGSRIGDVLRSLGKSKANYSLVVRMLKQAAAEQALDGRLVVNALPKPERAYDPSGSEMAMPEMFQGGMDGDREVAGDADLETLVSTDRVAAENEVNPASSSESKTAKDFKWWWQQ